ncbi:hypothetical protein PROFUN_16435 [Planoprotostelium fungivorum]|uniref:Uncharacterized protein n=1 Tax=Planoprotostelium fungivorum TaxID=1890364 RepID=A0A2P6MQR1_9EUKA|nr:hypothetical protein PROFUN_16435 [Planoprotostelium fungivorum]
MTKKNFFNQLQNDMAIRKTLKRSREGAIKRNRQETEENTALMDMSADFHLPLDIHDLLKIAGFDYLKDAEVKDIETRREVGLASIEENIKKEGVHQRITEIFEKYDRGRCPQKKKRKNGEKKKGKNGEKIEEKKKSEGEKFMKRVASFTKTHLGGVRIVKIQAKKDVKDGRKSSEHRWYDMVHFERRTMVRVSGTTQNDYFPENLIVQSKTTR